MNSKLDQGLSTQQRMDFVANVALSLLKEQGHFRFSMTEVSRKTDIPTGTLYRLFKSKDELIVYIFTRYVQSMRDVGEALKKQHLTAVEYLACVACFPCYFASIRSEPAGLDFVSSNNLLMDRVDTKFFDALSQLYRQMYLSQMNFLEEMIERGLLLENHERAEMLHKQLVVLGRGVSVVANHMFIPSDIYSLDDLLDFAISVARSFRWIEHEQAADKHKIVVALRSVSDRHLTINF